MTSHPHHGKRPEIAPTAFVAEGVHLIGDVIVEDQASVWFTSVLRADLNTIRIGKRTNIQDGSVLHVTKDLPVIIGADVTVGHRAIVHACTIEDGCLIGMGSIVMDRARIGKGSLVAAGAVVLQGTVVPEGSLVAGIPAKVVRSLTREEQSAILQSADDYVSYAQSYGK